MGLFPSQIPLDRLPLWDRLKGPRNGSAPVRQATLSGGCSMRIDFAPFFRSTVGFDRLIGLLESASEQGYPPYNIERSDENNYRVTLAVAGFAEKDLSVDVKDRVLTVSGKREGEAKANDKAQASFLHQGIAGRGFERSF